MQNPIDPEGEMSAGSTATGPEHVKADRMAYMADLLLELKEMAANEGHETLAGLLALAHTEALHRRR